jgi:hypothetical protein
LTGSETSPKEIVEVPIARAAMAGTYVHAADARNDVTGAAAAPDRRAEA